MTAWISYGAGVNSTAILVLAAQGRLDYPAFRCVFSDTGDERPETYKYLSKVAVPFAQKHEIPVDIVRPPETVLQRWRRLKVTGSRIIRSCTDHAKIQPIKKHLAEHGDPDDTQLIGIHAGESHRAKSKIGIAYPLVDMQIDHEACVEIIKAAGLPVPVKSGCWHCPFMRKAEVIELINKAPQKFQQIIDLEDAANQAHPRLKKFTHFGNRPAREWRDGGPLFVMVENDIPCSCFDGIDE